MTRAEITDRIKDKFEDLFDKEPIPDKDIKFQGVDSLDFVELVMEVEKDFGILITDEMAAKVVTLDDLVTIVDEAITR